MREQIGVARDCWDADTEYGAPQERDFLSHTGIVFSASFRAARITKYLLPIESTPCRPRRVRLEPELLDETGPYLA